MFIGGQIFLNYIKNKMRLFQKFFLSSDFVITMIYSY